MLTTPDAVISHALNLQYAIGAFNFSNLEIAQAAVWAAEESTSPVIIQTSEGAIKYGGLTQLATIATSLANEAKVPVVLHLDHGKTYEQAVKCIEAGYTSVMIDASKLEFDENIALTKRVVDYAKPRGVWVEAELGAILGAEGAKNLGSDKTPESVMTNPKEAREFVERTGCNSLAVSVGTIHGAFSGQEFIRFELLKEIESELDGFPLVVHGASGIAHKHLAEVATSNVCKINVDTEIRIAFERAVQAYFNQAHDEIDPRKIIGPAREAAQNVIMEKMKVFGSEGQASAINF